ncbi:Aspartyl protease inhibitor [Dirofilaria immitis]
MLLYLLLSFMMAKSQVQHAFINSFNGNIVCVNNVCYNTNGVLISGGIGCYVINGKIYKDGVYLRDMTSMDYQELEFFHQQVNEWSMNLQDNIQRSFPWDERNPLHTQFPWNMISGSKRRDLIKDENYNKPRRFIPFPEIPYFC